MERAGPGAGLGVCCWPPRTQGWLTVSIQGLRLQRLPSTLERQVPALACMVATLSLILKAPILKALTVGFYTGEMGLRAVCWKFPGAPLSAQQEKGRMSSSEQQRGHGDLLLPHKNSSADNWASVQRNTEKCPHRHTHTQAHKHTHVIHTLCIYWRRRGEN